MTTIDLKNLTIEKAHAALAAGEYTVRDLVRAYQTVAKEKNPEINAYLEIFRDDVIDEQIDHAQDMFTAGTATTLTGIPIAIKDNMLMTGHVASAASKMLGNHQSVYDGTVVKILKDAGVVILGRTNMDEFAMGSSTENSAYGPTKNPLALDRVPGGSSGGSAAAVAMDGALVSFGSDTGGSIRQPAAFCGLVGLKPSYGTVSRSGLIAMSSSLDQIGPFTKTVAEAETIFNIIATHDPLEATSVPMNERTVSFKPLTKRIGVPRTWVESDGIADSVKKNFSESLEKLGAAGYELVDIDMPLAEHSLAVYYILMPAEVSSNLARFDGIRYGQSSQEGSLLDVYEQSRAQGFGKETRRRILLGTYILSHGYYDAYYGNAWRLRRAIEKEFAALFETVDAIITPTSPFPPFKRGEKTANPLEMYMSDLFTVPANIAGIPAIAIPSGVDAENLPMSIQFMAPMFREDILFSIGKDFEQRV